MSVHLIACVLHLIACVLHLIACVLHLMACVFRHFLQPRSVPTTAPELGSLRVKICYIADHVFPSQHYNQLRNLLLEASTVSLFLTHLSLLLSLSVSCFLLTLHLSLSVLSFGLILPVPLLILLIYNPSTYSSVSPVKY
jgi:hypothetical protein